METMTQIKKGDLFRWRYKDEKAHSDYLNYWCCSRMCRADETHLVDLYWGDKNGARGIFTYEQAFLKINLEFIANEADLEKIEDWQACYYRQEDIVNLNHSNNSRGNVYRRKGTQRNREVMLDLAKQYQIDWTRRIKSDEDSLKRADKVVLEIESGCDLEKVYLNEPR